MLRFTLFGFPVQIQGSFWINSALMGGALSADTSEDWRHLLAWMVAVFLSILIHELGHAVTMRNQGDRQVGIILYAFGGLAQGSQLHTRREDFFISAAGPGWQILAGLAVGWSLTLWRVPSPWLLQMLDAFTAVSLFWALLNLVPVVPLDGGRLCMALVGNQRRALGISLVCAVVLALLSFEGGLWRGLQNSVMSWLDIHAHTRVGGGWFSLIFFGLLAWNNWQQLRRAPQIPWMNAR